MFQEKQRGGCLGCCFRCHRGWISGVSCLSGRRCRHRRLGSVLPCLPPAVFHNGIVRKLIPGDSAACFNKANDPLCVGICLRDLIQGVSEKYVSAAMVVSTRSATTLGRANTPYWVRMAIVFPEMSMPKPGENARKNWQR